VHARVDAENSIVIPEELTVVQGLGQGGFSIVVEVELRASPPGSVRLAMKCLSKRRHAKAKSRRILKLEIAALTQIAPSPFLIRCRAAFETPSDIFLVTDLLTGGDLYFHLEKMSDEGREGIPESQTRIVLAEVSLGLTHLHARGFLHRDIKIENIMIDGNGHVKIIDFGLVAPIPLDEPPLFEMPVTGAGSLIYMAPEVLRQKIGGRFTDWWAMGVLAYELFTGRSPWSTLSDINQIKTEIASSVIHPPFGVSPKAGRFCAALMNRNRHARLGARKDTDVLECSFFEGIDWEAMERGETPPAFDIRQGGLGVPADDAEAVLEEYQSQVTTENDRACANFPDFGLSSAATAPPIAHAIAGPSS